MLDKYENWIQSYTGDIHRKCIEVSTGMQQVFPELRIVKGLVRIIDNDRWYEHQWCISPDGRIIDPTRMQWVMIIEYKEITENDPQPTGKCMNCGEFLFDRGYEEDNFVCSKECSISYAKDVCGI